MLWPLYIAIAKLRPVNLSLLVRATVVFALFALFLWGDYALFRKLFSSVATIESLTPFFALGLIENLLGMVFLTATSVLFFSTLTVAIGSFFSDLDLEVYHAAPVGKMRIVVARWGKSAVQSSYLMACFLFPLFVALAAQYDMHWTFVAGAMVRLILLMLTPLNLALTIVLLLVRLFPVRRVHQVAVTLALITFTVAVVGFRMTRPERLFQDVRTDDLVVVLQQIELPAADYLPGNWLAEWVTSSIQGERPSVAGTGKLALLAALSTLLFLATARFIYFAAFVRARETLAPSAAGSRLVTSLIDRLMSRATPPIRALMGKEIRVVTRDAGQWSQLFMMIALLFIYLYNIRMLPLAGDARATLVAYANVGMAGFVIAAISLRFAYPSVSAEGRAFWLMQTSPIPYGDFLKVKVLVYAAPLLLLSTFLTAMANLLLDAPGAVWIYTMVGSVVTTFTLVSLGVGMGGWSPNFASENPLQVGLSLGGFAYMALSMIYVGLMMVLIARPVHRFLFASIFGDGVSGGFAQSYGPAVTALVVSLVLGTVPLEIARRRVPRV
ncbi:MAG TPA: hypothetical protein VNM92_17445 [Thermoanaerobaculia bacterium]|nr:hypothetical protein [Thermoanaerobaculia bacterium]